MNDTIGHTKCIEHSVQVHSGSTKEGSRKSLLLYCRVVNRLLYWSCGSLAWRSVFLMRFADPTTATHALSWESGQKVKSNSPSTTTATATTSRTRSTYRTSMSHNGKEPPHVVPSPLFDMKPAFALATAEASASNTQTGTQQQQQQQSDSMDGVVVFAGHLPQHEHPPRQHTRESVLQRLSETLLRRSLTKVRVEWTGNIIWFTVT